MTTVILGGTRGLGNELALQCRAAGQRTCVVGSSAVDDHTADFPSLQCDLTSESNTLEFIEKLHQLGPIHHFWWVAGVFMRGPFETHDTQDLLRMVDVNFRNSLIVAQWMWQHMYHTTTPSSYNVIGSTSGDKPRHDQVVYAATKYAQSGFTRSLGDANTNTNLKVHLFLPGGMQTDMWASEAKNETYDQFMDPARVATHMISCVDQQTTFFAETTIPRGSLPL